MGISFGSCMLQSAKLGFRLGRKQKEVLSTTPDVGNGREGGSELALRDR